MKKNLSLGARLFACVFFPVTMAIMLAGPPAAHAGLTVDVHLYHDTYGYYFYPWLSTNASPPDFPDGYYMIASPQIPTGGSQLQYQATNNTINFITGGGNYYGDFDSFLYGITNGQWSIWVTNSTSTNQYNFTVTVTGVTSNSFGVPVVALFPTNSAQFVTNQPLFQWTGPVNWAGALNVSDYYIDNSGNNNYEASASLPPDQTSWPCPVVLPNGTNDFSAIYSSSVTAMIIAAVPTNGNAQPISGWVSTSTLETRFTYDSKFIVGLPVLGSSSSGHTNIAHYSFDNSGNLGQDSSGNGNDMSGPTWWGPVYQFDADAKAGGGAVVFFDTSCLYADGQTLTNLNAVLAGSFTFSAWVKTTVTNGADYNNAFFGATIFWAYNDQGNTNDTIPLSITGSKAAFTTRDHLGNFNTLHSISSVTDGNYHLITATRNQASGQKKIYVDGNFETSEFGTTDLLNSDNYRLTIGGWAYCTDGNCTNYYAYNGLLDDLQVYSGVLSDADVTNLFANPGTAVADVAAASGGPVAHYDFDEGTVLAPDVSGNNNNMVYAGNFGGSGPSISSDTVTGSGGSVSFDGGSYLTASSNLLSTLAGEFSVSLWWKTSQSFGNPGDLAWEGAGVIAADSPNAGAKDLIPVALTGGQVAFNIGDGISDNTLNSSVTVKDDTWHHVVVTRNQSTGARQIFIDGTLDSSDTATTVLLNTPVLLTIGAKSDASNPDPASPDSNGSNGYQGLLDDIQMYDRVLSSSEVAFLYNNPGAVIAGGNLNHPPVATNMLVTRTAGLSVKIFWADVTNQWSDPDGDAVTMAGINLVTTNAVTVSTNGLLILYPASAPNVADQISYTISDSLGATATGYINIVVTNGVTGTNSITSITHNGNSSTTVTAFGIPTYSYILERATNLAPAIWVDITTNTATVNGIITATDSFTDLGNVAPASAFYRLKWQP